MFSRFFGIAFGLWFGVAAARADRPGTALLVLIALALAYRAGRWRRPPSSIAIAEARAHAVNAVQVNVQHQRPEYPGPRAPLQLVADSEPRPVDRDELAAAVAGELDAPPDDDYVEWIAEQLTREASTETT